MKTLSTLSRWVLLALVFLGICGITYLAVFTDLLKPLPQQGQSLASTGPLSNEALERIAKRDPIADAARAIATNDLRFVAISGSYAPAIPGIADYDDWVYTNGINWVSGDGRGLSSRTFEKAIEYATAYNKIVLARLKQK